MGYTIVGLRETGDMTLHDRDCLSPPDQAALEEICCDYSYIQVVVSEDRFGGYAKRYVYSLEPRLTEAPM